MSTAPKPEIELTLLERVTSLQALTSEELIERGERLIKLGQQLATMSMGIVPASVIQPEQRSVGRLGVVTEATAIQAAKVLGEFERSAFADALGLKAAGTSRWLAKLLAHNPPIIERTQKGGYRYIPPPADAPTSRVRRPAPETQAIDQSIVRGQPVPVDAVTRAARGKRDVLSKPRQGHRARQASQRAQRLAEGEAKRAAKSNGHAK